MAQRKEKEPELTTDRPESNGELSIVWRPIGSNRGLVIALLPYCSCLPPSFIHLFVGLLVGLEMPAVLSQAPTLQPSSKSKASDGAAKEHSTPTEGAAVVVTCVSSSSATTTHLANELPSTPSSDTVSLKLATPQGTVQRIVIDTRNRVGRLHYYPPWHCLFEDGNMLCNLVARRLPQPSSYLAPLEQGDGDGDGDGAQSFVCGLNGCRFVCERGTAEWQAHMLACHQFVCSECGRTLHSARFLDRHLLESHDALFKTLAATKKMYECLVDGCSKLFWDANGRRQHLLRYHQLSEASAAFFLSQVGNYRRRRKRYPLAKSVPSLRTRSR